MKSDEAEKQLFARLALDGKFREFLAKELQGEYEICASTLDKDFWTRSQGRAGLLQKWIKKLDEARKATS